MVTLISIGNYVFWCPISTCSAWIYLSCLRIYFCICHKYLFFCNRCCYLCCILHTFSRINGFRRIYSIYNLVLPWDSQLHQERMETWRQQHRQLFLLRHRSHLERCRNSHYVQELLPPHQSRREHYKDNHNMICRNDCRTVFYYPSCWESRTFECRKRWHTGKYASVHHASAVDVACTVPHGRKLGTVGKIEIAYRCAEHFCTLRKVQLIIGCRRESLAWICHQIAVGVVWQGLSLSIKKATDNPMVIRHP